MLTQADLKKWLDYDPSTGTVIKTGPIDFVIISMGLLCLAFAFLLAMHLNLAVGKELVIASTYGDARDIRRTGETRVATGARLDPNKFSVAHKTLPFGTWLTLRHGHRSAVVVVDDRGPFIKGRTFDLKPAVNKQLWCGGLCRVRVEPWPPLPKPSPIKEKEFDS